MNIRTASVEDAREISMELWLPLAREMEQISYYKLNEDIDEDYLVNYREEKIEASDSFTVVAESGSNLIGFASFTADEVPQVFARKKSAKINELFVKENLRRQGGPSELLEEVYKEAKRRGCDSIELNVNTGNESAEKLYRKEGFKPEKLKMIKDI